MLDYIRMFSREQMDLAWPVGQLFHTYQGQVFQCLIVNNLKLYFYFNILDNDIIFSRNIPDNNGKTLTSFRTLFSMSPCSANGISISSVQQVGALKFWTMFAQVISVMKENDGNRCVRVLFFHHTSQRLHKFELFDSVLCWDWVADSLSAGSVFTSSCKILSSVYWKMLS